MSYPHEDVQHRWAPYGSQVTIWRIPTDNPESVRLLNTYWGTAAPWLNQCKFVLPLYGGAYQDGAALLVRGRFQSTLMAKLETGSVGCVR